MNFSAVQLAFSSLRRQKRRTLLTMLAVSIGITAVITIMAAGKGMQRLILSQLDIFGPDAISIQTKVPNKKHQSGDFGSVGITVTTMKENDLQAVMKHPNIAAVYGMVSGQEAVSYQGQIKKIMLMGHGAAWPEVEKVTMREGRFFTKDEEASLSSVAVLGSKAKDKLFGDDSALEKTIYIRGKSFRVVGVLATRGSAFFLDLDNVIYLPSPTMQKKLLGIDYYQQMIARLKDASKTKITMEDLSDLLRFNHSITDSSRDDFAIQSTADAQATLTTVTDGITLLLVALVGISLIVGGVGIMNIMYVSVAERTFEIGLRKSLGAKRQDILRQFLAEAVIITLGGGGVGIITGALLAALIYYVALSFGLQWTYSISLASILLAVGFSAGIGVLFGFYPARKAAGLHPIEALRKE